MKGLAKVQETVTKGNKELLWMLSDENPTIYTTADLIEKTREVLQETMEEVKDTIRELEQLKRQP